MLACDCEDKKALEWPMIATPKVDGIRCLRPDERVLTRSFKPIPNKHIRDILERILPIGADGELFSSEMFNQVTSDVMSEDGTPDFKYCMFDFVPNGNLNVPYEDRLSEMDRWYKNASDEVKKYVFILPWTIINSLEELNVYEDKVLAEKHEGAMLRTFTSPYKCGRSTFRERYLLKVKQFKDSEARVLGFEEQLTNTNETTLDEFGLTERSTKEEGMKPAGTLGKFICVDIHNGMEFNCGTGKGLTKVLRQQIWDNRDQYIGKIFKYKYQVHGTKDKPRLPVWLGFRDERDM